MWTDNVEPDYLFRATNGLQMRMQQPELAAQSVDQLSDYQIGEKDDDEIVSSIVPRYVVQVPVLDLESVEFEQTSRLTDRQDMFGQVVKHRIAICRFTIPYEGDASIFSLQPQTFSSSIPQGLVRGLSLIVEVQGETDAVAIKRKFDSLVSEVEQYLRWHRDMWAGLDVEIARAVRVRLSQRRQRIATSEAAKSDLKGLGFRPKGG